MSLVKPTKIERTTSASASTSQLEVPGRSEDLTSSKIKKSMD